MAVPLDVPYDTVMGTVEGFDSNRGKTIWATAPAAPSLRTPSPTTSVGTFLLSRMVTRATDLVVSMPAGTLLMPTQKKLLPLRAALVRIGMVKVADNWPAGIVTLPGAPR